MKRKLTTLLFALISIFTYAQIQDTFFGITLGETNMDDAIDHLNYKFDLTITDEEDDDTGSIEFHDAKLGGIKWDYITMSFYDGIFSDILLYFPTENQAEALEAYDFILNKMKQKYESDSTIISFEGDLNKESLIASYVFGDRSCTNLCCINTELSESKGGRMLYYLKLNYWNEPLRQKRTESEIDEF